MKRFGVRFEEQLASSAIHVVTSLFLHVCHGRFLTGGERRVACVRTGTVHLARRDGSGDVPRMGRDLLHAQGGLGILSARSRCRHCKRRNPSRDTVEVHADLLDEGVGHVLTGMHVLRSRDVDPICIGQLQGHFQVTVFQIDVLGAPVDEEFHGLNVSRNHGGF